MVKNNNPDTLSIFTTLLGLSNIAVTEIRDSADGRTVTFGSAGLPVVAKQLI